MSKTTIVIVLDLDLDDDTDCPFGTATVADAEPRSFHGWLGLTAAIEALTKANSPFRTPLKGEPA